MNSTPPPSPPTPDDEGRNILADIPEGDQSCGDMGGVADIVSIVVVVILLLIVARIFGLI